MDELVDSRVFEQTQILRVECADRRPRRKPHTQTQLLVKAEPRVIVRPPVERVEHVGERRVAFANRHERVALTARRQVGLELEIAAHLVADRLVVGGALNVEALVRAAVHVRSVLWRRAE